jgi:two-component system OmpR family response regulator
VLSRAQILDHVWDYNFTGDSNIIESYICGLRRKLDSGQARLIHTIRGMGYMRIPPP